MSKKRLDFLFGVYLAAIGRKIEVEAVHAVDEEPRWN